jgi:hypothetical protein
MPERSSYWLMPFADQPGTDWPVTGSGSLAHPDHITGE